MITCTVGDMKMVYSQDEATVPNIVSTGIVSSESREGKLKHDLAGHIASDLARISLARLVARC